MIPIFYAPDADTWWETNPGALTDVTQLAPLSRGSYGTTGSIKQFTITGTDYLYGKTFRQVSGSTRFLVFRKQNIDEYTNAGVRTNQGTGYSASTAAWSAAGFGNAVIATNYLDAPVVSTGTTFSALSGSPPKARLVAANNNFVMFADYDDGVNQYGDGWWCSGIGNYTTWTASASTQAANGRILDVSGPIRALIAYKDQFLAFKDNSIHVLNYEGPPVIWSVRAVSSSIGCHGMRGVCELRGSLYFAHSSGFYVFDGSSMKSIGDSIENSILKRLGEIDRQSGPTLSAITGASLATCQVVADDVENIVWFCFAEDKVADATHSYCLHQFGFNVSTGKWGYVFSPFYAYSPVVVDSSHTDAKSFGFTSYALSRVITIKTPSATSGVYCQAYPYKGNTDDETYGEGSFTTGVIGSPGQANRLSRVYWHSAYNNALSDTTQVSTVSVVSVKNSARTFGGTTHTSTVNTELDCADVTAHGPFYTVTVASKTNIPCEFFGLTLEHSQEGRR